MDQGGGGESGAEPGGVGWSTHPGAGRSPHLRVTEIQSLVEALLGGLRRSKAGGVGSDLSRVT